MPNEKVEKTRTALTTHNDAEAASAVADRATRNAHEVEHAEQGGKSDEKKVHILETIAAHNKAADAHNQAAAAHGEAARMTKDAESGSKHMAALSYHAQKAIEHRTTAKYMGPVEPSVS